MLKSVGAKGDFRHFRSSEHHAEVTYDWQGVISYQCSTLTLGLSVVELDASRNVVPPQQQRERLTGTGVNPPGMPGAHPPNILVGGTSAGISPQYYYVLSNIADQYWLPSVRSASSRFHSAIRRQLPFHTPPHSVVRPPNLELALTSLLTGCSDRGTGYGLVELPG